MINAIPVLGWILSLIFTASLSLPFWLIWTVYGIGQKYFYWIPETYQSIPFQECIGLFMVISILKSVLIPKFISIEQKNSKNA